MKINKGSFPNEPTCARSGRATAQKSLAGALGIPECMPPVGGRTFIVKRKDENDYEEKNSFNCGGSACCDKSVGMQRKKRAEEAGNSSGEKHYYGYRAERANK